MAEEYVLKCIQLSTQNVFRNCFQNRSQGGNIFKKKCVVNWIGTVDDFSHIQISKARVLVYRKGTVA